MAGPERQRPVHGGYKNPPGIILAVAEYAESPATARLPRLLKEAFLSQRWGLPHAGGWKDNWPLSEHMTIALNVYHAVTGWKAAKNIVKWSEQHPSEWRTVQNVMTLRKAAKEAHGPDKQTKNHSGR